jgi:hypothetical protein
MLHIKLKKALIVVHVDHLKLDLGTVPLAWAINREPEVESERENSFQTPEPSLHDPEQDEDPVDITDRDGAINLQTPSPRRQSRRGRAIRKPMRYSPDCI